MNNPMIYLRKLYGTPQGDWAWAADEDYTYHSLHATLPKYVGKSSGMEEKSVSCSVWLLAHQ
jgi:hypothetical protein